MMTFEIYNFVYTDVCSDSYFGKSGTCHHIGFVTGTEENVKSLVDELNAKRGSRYPYEPENEWDRNWEDADYIAYRKVNTVCFDVIRGDYRCRWCPL